MENSTPRPPEPERKGLPGFVLIAGFIAVLFIGSYALFRKPSPAPAHFTSDTKTTPVPEEKAPTLADKLKKELASVNSKKFSGSTFRGSIENVQLEAGLFAVWGKMIQQGKYSSTKEEVVLAKKLEKKIAAIQVAQFPAMRREYAQVIKDKLWTQNIYVTISGTGNTTLRFVGGAFANNKNIQDTQTTLQEVLHMLRFKQTQYRWYREASEFTYYKVESLKDGVTSPDL